MKVTQLGPTLCDLTDYTVHGILQAPSLQVDSLPAEPQGKPKNTGVGGLSLLQWISLTQEWNWSLLHCRQILYHLSYQGITVNKIYYYKYKLNFIYQCS